MSSTRSIFRPILSLVWLLATLIGASAQFELRGPTGNLPSDGWLPLNYTAVGSPADFSVVVRNTGTSPIENLTAAVSGTNPQSFTAVLDAERLLPGAETNLRVRFSPVAWGYQHGLITLKRTGASGFRLNVFGYGSKISNIEVRQNNVPLIDGVALAEFGTVNIGESKSIQFSIKNTSGVPLSGVDCFVSGPASSNFRVDQVPNRTLAPSESVLISATFVPSVSGVSRATLKIGTAENGNVPFLMDVTGNGLSFPEIQVSRDGRQLVSGEGSEEFGLVSRGSERLMRVSITNAGRAELAGVQARIGDPASSHFAITRQPAVAIGPGESSELEIRFRPQSAGLQTATVVVSSNDPDEKEFAIPVSGVGTNVPEITIFRAGINLVGGSSTVHFKRTIPGRRKVTQLRIVNTGTAELTLRGRIFGGASAKTFRILPGHQKSLPPGGATDMRVMFLPSKPGKFIGTLRIVSNDSDEQWFDLPLAGFAVKKPEVRITRGNTEIFDGRSRLNFGRVKIGESVEQTIRIRNSGWATLKLGKMISLGPNRKEFTILNGKPTSLKPRGFADLKVRFAPSKTGNAQSVLRIATNDPSERFFVIRLFGHGKTSRQPASSGRNEATTIHLGQVKYRTATATGVTSAIPRPIIEVSDDLVHWYSGGNHLEKLWETETAFRSRDKTPIGPGKRYIRVRRR